MRITRDSSGTGEQSFGVYYDPAVGPDILRIWAEAFGVHQPALTTVRVAGLTSPDFLLEIEDDAVAVG